MNVLTQVASKTTNDIIILAIVFFVGLVVVIPFYKVWSKSKKEAAKEKRDDYTQREKVLIEVVTKNTEAITTLTGHIKTGQENSQSFERQLYDYVKTLENKMDKSSLVINDVHTILIERAKSTTKRR